MSQLTEMSVIKRAAETLKRADYVLITAGAGLGVDSGLPDFRGVEGFWRAYPPMKQLNLRFEEMSTPRWFKEDPQLAWGFFGHRQNLYKTKDPHDGYHILKRIVDSKGPDSYFIHTSNVDGHFERCHGSIQHLQCTKRCDGIWGVQDHHEQKFPINVDPVTFRAQGELPKCPTCDALCRPNVLMFSDSYWNTEREEEQEAFRSEWLDKVLQQCKQGKKMAIIEIGAGKYVPTIRYLSENMARTTKGTLIRINVRESEMDRIESDSNISISLGGLEALTLIEKELFE
ncbi:NAD-dependent protein deacetylase sirtuin [Acrasis kona]|uniref:NAD-dependent protein deacetylase sirtuin n=1 Tax=Acrasis kona TaxID=1008807 RepID=A0AAW2YJS0_9EUKA